MRSFSADPAAPDDVRALARHDRVRVPDGRIGEVIGFYRADDEPMLVLFGTAATAGGTPGLISA